MIPNLWIAVASLLLGLAAAAIANLALHDARPSLNHGCGGASPYATSTCQPGG